MISDDTGHTPNSAGKRHSTPREAHNPRMKVQRPARDLLNSVGNVQKAVAIGSEVGGLGDHGEDVPSRKEHLVWTAMSLDDAIDPLTQTYCYILSWPKRKSSPLIILAGYFSAGFCNSVVRYDDCFLLIGTFLCVGDSVQQITFCKILFFHSLVPFLFV